MARSVNARTRAAASSNAVIVGQADAMTADYRVTALGTAPLKALEHLIQTGDYKTILSNWSLSERAITTPSINRAPTDRVR